MRRYFIMEIGDTEDPTRLTYLQEALYLCIGEPHSQRFSLNGSKLLIKTNENKLEDLFIRYPNTTLEQLLIDTRSVEYDYEGIIEVLNNEEWSLNEI
jgi:hypothetical protein